MSLSAEELSDYLARQINYSFPDKQPVSTGQLEPAFARALERVDYCFNRIRRKYFSDGASATLNHLNSDQYSMFLYFMSNTVYKSEGDPRLATKVYYLNKALHGIDVYYEVELPDVFLFRHCVGTVLGRAEYADYFSVGQNCTVGNNKNIYPRFEEEVAMYNGSMVVGKCIVGRNSHISAHTFVRDQDVPGDSIVFGRSPDLEVRPSRTRVYDKFFDSLEAGNKPGPATGRRSAV